MMSPEKRKKIAVAIALKFPKKGESDEGDGEEMAEDDEDMGEDKYLAGARAVRKALASEDDEKIAKALRSFVAMCDGEDMAEDEDE